MQEKSKSVLIVTDRDRNFLYDGQETTGNQYKCFECCRYFIMERPAPDFCPRCGIEFDSIDDVSV